MTRTARRGFLIAMGGAAGGAIGWRAGGAGFDRTSTPGRAAFDTARAAVETYVDRDGWMLSVEDTAKIDALQSAPVEVSDQ